MGAAWVRTRGGRERLDKRQHPTLKMGRGRKKGRSRKKRRTRELRAGVKNQISYAKREWEN